MLIPTMSGKESAGTARVKAAEITTQKRGRLEARWARGHTHLMVGMRPERTASSAILSFTRSSRAHGLMEILCIEFYADVPAACQQRCRAELPLPANGSSTLTRQREAANQRSQCRYRLLCRMQLVAAVWHIHHICERLLRQRRSALRQQICLLMLIAKEPALRAIGLAKHDVSDRLKTRLFPRLEERIDFVQP